jgi:hypothetical protein
MRRKYTYKLYPGQGYAGLVNGKKFTGFYDERDLEELKDELSELEKQETESHQQINRKREEENNKSFRDKMRELSPKFTAEYEKWLKAKQAVT